MQITFSTIEHESQRYPTSGDWQIGENGELHIIVSRMKNDDYEFLVALHELIEAKLCQKRGITDEKVTQFDKAFETVKKIGNEDEPGDDPFAPYQNEHCLATGIERIMCAALGIKWDDYERAVNAL